MLLGIVRAQTRAKTGDVTWIAPYFPMLQTWADELVLTTEFPANQICTDDFTVHQIIRFICRRYMTEVSTYTASSMLVDTPTISLSHSADTHTHTLSLSLSLSLSLPLSLSSAGQTGQQHESWVQRYHCDRNVRGALQAWTSREGADDHEDGLCALHHHRGTICQDLGVVRVHERRQRAALQG